ncbi:MAG: hypothetical protein SCH98_10745 [Deferrisomatales bacterium]|nr:hypothetical protein [Deferrisomatales bacterium]
MRNSGYDVLVTGADQRQGLALIRALGTGGERVFAAGPHRRSIGFHSRYAAGRGCYPPPQDDKQAFAGRILDLVREHRISVVFPSGESEVIALDEFRDSFPPGVALAMAPRDSLTLALDKRRTYSLAEAVGVPCPRTCCPGSVPEATAFAREVGFPVVLKRFAMPTYGRTDRGRSVKVAYAKDPPALEKALEVCGTAGCLPLVQEYVSGDGVCQGTVCVSGEARGVYQYRRAREYPVTGGVTAVHVTEAVDPVPLAWTRRLLGEMRFEGLAQVEYRRSRKTGRYVLIEVNGRCWAPISGALRAGLNYPLAHYRHLTGGEAVELPPAYPVGRRTRYLRGDLSALEQHLQGRTPDYLEPLPSRGRLLWDILKDFSPGTRGDVHDWGDPSPSLWEAASLGNRYGRRAAGALLRFAGVGRRRAAEPSVRPDAGA